LRLGIVTSDAILFGRNDLTRLNEDSVLCLYVRLEFRCILEHGERYPLSVPWQASDCTSSSTSKSLDIILLFFCP
jgi:hypothetical protein